jgi:hypothetical protein
MLLNVDSMASIDARLTSRGGTRAANEHDESMTPGGKAMELKPVRFEANICVKNEQVETLRSLERLLKVATNYRIRIDEQTAGEIWSLTAVSKQPIDLRTILGLSRVFGFSDDEWKFHKEVELSGE